MKPLSALALGALSLLLADIGCDSSTGGGGGGGDAGGAGGAAAVIPQARSTAARVPASAIDPARLAGAVTANNAFAVDLYQRVRAEKGDGNLLTSPLSASVALTMAYAGARTQTATEMATALHLGDEAPTIFEGQNALAQALDGRAAAALAHDQQMASYYGAKAPAAGDYKLSVVNAVWGEQSCTWSAPFLDILAEDYGAGVWLVDFLNQFEQARLTINGWVADTTSHKIEDLLPEKSLDADTRMVLVNAIHLKLPWADAFEAEATTQGTFTRGNGSGVDVKYMHRTDTMTYLDDGDAQIVSLKLAGGEMAVVIALPHGDLATYEAGLSPGKAPLALPQGSTNVELTLPRFTFTSPTFSLKNALRDMGMDVPWTLGLADFSGMNGDCLPLHILDVLQKTMIGLNETGVEAAAATAVIVSGSSSGVGVQPQPMIVNRPFVISILDVPTGAVLFLGHVDDPS